MCLACSDIPPLKTKTQADKSQAAVVEEDDVESKTRVLKSFACDVLAIVADVNGKPSPTHAELLSVLAGVMTRGAYALQQIVPR